MKIYTRTGDDGTTALFSGGRVSKTHLRVEAYGTVDELNSVIGVVRTYHPHAESWLVDVQNQLFYVGTDLATPLSTHNTKVTRIGEDYVIWLEEHIDEMTAELPTLANFILPGGVAAAAYLHVARTVCRRAERLTVALASQEPVNEALVSYLNRLSDFLFTLARWENYKAGISEEKWSVD
ncbi:MAG: cob(I)yrinic acid a,c-diamide adenosyltransferase [Anaerolineae bacterium]|nr:cob(I)yrinic acid a,c-diamide adenosyltransferase [Anaerolineae bacterium]